MTPHEEQYLSTNDRITNVPGVNFGKEAESRAAAAFTRHVPVAASAGAISLQLWRSLRLLYPGAEAGWGSDHPEGCWMRSAVARFTVITL